MPRDIVELAEGVLSEDPAKWAKLASDVQYRRLQLLLLREILIELREVRREIVERGGERIGAALLTQKSFEG